MGEPSRRCEHAASAAAAACRCILRFLVVFLYFTYVYVGLVHESVGVDLNAVYGCFCLFFLRFIYIIKHILIWHPFISWPGRNNTFDYRTQM